MAEYSFASSFDIIDCDFVVNFNYSMCGGQNCLFFCGKISIITRDKDPSNRHIQF